MQGESVEIEPYEPKNADWAGTVDMDVGFNTIRTQSNETFDTEELSQMFTTVSVHFQVALPTGSLHFRIYESRWLT